MRQFIASHVVTHVTGTNYRVLQKSGQNSWVDVDDERITFGPVEQDGHWQLLVGSGGGPIDIPDDVQIIPFHD
jgi:hypothetical protein